MKAQREVAKTMGKDHVVITGKHTRVTKPMEESGTVIVRRKGLGPTAPQVSPRKTKVP